MFFLISLRFIFVFHFITSGFAQIKWILLTFSVVEEMLLFEMSPFQEKIPLGQRDVARDVKFSHFLLEEIIMALFWH